MSLTILIVDDEPLLREELQESLELEGFAVDAAGNGVEALARCAGAAYDVVVTDLKMPEMGGLDLIRALRERAETPGAIMPKTIILSGHGAERNRETAQDLGAAACLAKPVDVDDLIGEIRAATA